MLDLAAGMLLLSAALAGGTAETETRSFAERFCAHRLAGDEDALRALFTPGLAALVADAESRNAVIAQGAPDEKPPLGDGLPWAAFPDAAESCEPRAVEVADNAVIVAVAYTFEGEPDSGWTDRLVLHRSPDGYRLDDILFYSFPTDTYRAGLRRLLTDMFDQ